jgi:hypothetical protein
MNKKPRRGKIYLGAKLQSRILRRVATYWFLYHVALWQGMFFLEYLRRGDAFFNGAPAISFAELLRSFAWQNVSLVIAAIAVGPLLLWDVCRLTHRIAGPLLRLEKTLLRMAHDERVAPLNCREGDLIPGVERAFNAYLARLDERQAAARVASAAASSVAVSGPCWNAIPTDGEAGELSDSDFNSLLKDITSALQPIEPGRITL